MKRTPLYARQVDLGARMVEFAGWQMPVQFSGLIDEHTAVRKAAGLFDVSHMGEIAVTGAGALDFLQRMTPNDVSRLTPGRAHYSALLREDGGFLDDLLVYCRAPGDYLLVVNAARREQDWQWLQEHASSEVSLEDLSDQLALLALQGPRSEAILQPLTDVDLATLRYYRFRQGGVSDVAALISRTGYTGEDGFELYVSWQQAVEVWDRLLEQGEAAGLRPAGLGARDTLRLEAGMLLSGQDMNENVTPLEVGLGWTVKLGKGEFVGRQALERQKAEGIGRCLLGFEIADRGIARDGSAVWRGDRRVGTVTSGTFSPTLRKAIGLALLDIAPDSGDADPGEALEIEVRQRRLDARIVEVPFYRRER